MIRSTVEAGVQIEFKQAVLVMKKTSLLCLLNSNTKNQL